ncbi:hypothetical protein SISNIDRAFT_489981 [Sistotremastrum niveocremeum HHB9708]|uniref:DUF6535 domain-containing protein n=1 Tax=Sistotremastrum niveocremeum HHB9708 TaxID=1314777 RepID=A0A164PB71_9AGAM|nr:hypothetical protein SISNIDRAFT_489981 [Sistotremastrum niveocremeum HHB9708]
MSTPPDPPDPPSPLPESAISTAKSPSSLSASINDPFDTPLFNGLIGLIKELNVTVKEQKIALEEQSMIATKQREMLEEQMEVMKDMRRALEGHNKSTTRNIPNDTQEDNCDSGFPKPRAPEEVTRPDDRSAFLLDELPSTEVVRVSTIKPESQVVDGTENHLAAKPSEERVDAKIRSAQDRDPGLQTTVETPKDSIHEILLLLSKTVETVKETLITHGKKFDILTRDAEKDDQPYDQKAIDDESTCTALFEMAMTRTKEEVDDWIKRMDVSLVFIALFSAVLTAFLIPAAQDLSPSSGGNSGSSNSPPPVPDVSAQNICVLFYLALILSILDAVLSVLGRQWLSKLTNRPEGSTYRERLLRHLERERLAKRWLKYLVEGLHVILLWSIGLFVAGLLYQLWNLGVSFEENAPRLLATWGLGIVLSLSILATVVAATMHALLYEVSPFGGPVSKLLLKIIKSLSKFFDTGVDMLENLNRWLKARISWIPWALITVALLLLTTVPLWLSCFLIEEWRVEFDTEEKEKLHGAFMDLIAEASDPKLLERAVSSFSYVEWFELGEGTAEQLEKMENRLMATDTSVRVRETLKARAQQFIPYGAWKGRDLGSSMTKELVSAILQSQCYPLEFGEEFLSASFWKDNADLRALSLLSFEECVSRILCSYNHHGKLGDRQRLFHSAERHCWVLLQEGKRDDVTRILSHVDRLDLIKSYVQCPRVFYDSMVEFIVEGRKHDLLRGINEFLKTVDQSRLDPYSLSDVFLILASPLPMNVDLSSLIDYFSRDPHHFTWKKTSPLFLAYLNSCNLSQLSDLLAVRRFLEQCVDTAFDDEDGDRHPTTDEFRARARDLLAELSRLSSSPTGAIMITSAGWTPIYPVSSSHSTTRTPPPKDLSQPIARLSTSTAVSPSPGSANFDFAGPVASLDPESDIPIDTLTRPSSVHSSSETDPALGSTSQIVFHQSPSLEMAQTQD